MPELVTLLPEFAVILLNPLVLLVLTLTPVQQATNAMAMEVVLVEVLLSVRLLINATTSVLVILPLVPAVTPTKQMELPVTTVTLVPHRTFATVALA